MTQDGTLHILSKANVVGTVLPLVAESDSLLLTGDGVYAALIAGVSLPNASHALHADVEARGLLSRWPAAVSLTDHTGFVQLCVQHARSLSWS